MSGLLPIVAIIGWAPLVLVLFAMLPARRAVVVGTVGAWLFLPPVTINFPGFPDYGKSAAATVGVLIGAAVFESPRLFAFRVRWFDLPIILFSATPFFTSLSNDLGVYDGLSAVVQQMITWLFPYLVGRLYLTDLDAVREMAMGMVIGGLLLLPLILFELRMSPQLLRDVYGVGNWEGAMRYGVYRPRVFFSAGLELGLWMSAVSLISWWTWLGGALKRIGGASGGMIVAVFLVITILCRSTGSVILLILGMVVPWTCRRFQSRAAMWALLWAAPAYFALRISNLWGGDQMVALTRAFINEERAQSLEFRLINDSLLIAKMFQRPFLGWGGYGRMFVYDDYGRVLSVSDGLWIVILSSLGIVGLVLMTLSMLLPPFLFVRRFPVHQWSRPAVVPAVAIATVVGLAMLDGLMNGMLNLLYLIGAGGLANLATLPRDSLPSTGSRRRDEPADSEPIPAVAPSRGPSDSAARYRALARSLQAEGRISEAKSAWEHALAVAADAGGTPSGAWCDQANDLAWMLANTPDETQRDPARAVDLGRAVTQAHPESATYWNTLGAALHRAAAHHEAVAALEHAVSLSGGGTPFDFLFLAMAHARLGDPSGAETAFNQAMFLINRDRIETAALSDLRDQARSLLKSLESPAPASP